MRTSLVARTLLCFSLTVAFCGCGSGVPGGGSGGGTESMRVTFDAGSGTFAVAKDDAGNEYSFRATEDENGDTVIVEANIKTTDGTTLKASLDREGRPVNFRMSDNTAADLIYSGDSVTIRLTAADGTLIEDGQEVNYALAASRVRDRRDAARVKRDARLKPSDSARATVLRNGLAKYEEIVESIFDEEGNADSPLATNDLARKLKEAALRIGRIGSQFDLEEVDEEEISDEVTIDEIPDVIRKLAGNTFVLFDAEGFCLEFTDVASRLTFDSNGILQTEFDRHLVFPDFSLGGSGEPGITINYSTGVPVNLTPGDDVDFGLIVTPIFTGTQLDDLGHITIERRFQADLTFDVELFGVAAAGAEQLFDAAFLNGELNEEIGLLEFDLVLVDLQDANPVLQLGRLRYHNQNNLAPEMAFPCEVEVGQNVDSGVICPGSVPEGTDFTVEYIFAHDDYERPLDFDWFISDGYGYIVGGAFESWTDIRATAGGFMEVTLVVSDLSDATTIFKAFTCGINVERGADGPPPPQELLLECPPGLNVGEPGFFTVSGADITGLEFPNWFVFGTSDFFVTNPHSPEVVVEFYQPGKYEVAFQGYDQFGFEFFVGCEVLVGGLGFDECAANGWYGDGVCDQFCLEPDPDCEFFNDICEMNNWYGDGACDDFCPYPDPDCDGTFVDPCADNGWYGDGACDLYCPMPDPDCDVTVYDICAENGWYEDGVCDEICPHPDPDCTGEFVDICEANGWYGDRECDEFCPFPDPDCELIDICADNGWYGDGECDLFCPTPDPDCAGLDDCALNGWYGDGECDFFCPEPDPDCETAVDECEVMGWYGDGECDPFCPMPDPDCSVTDDCEIYGWYGDGVCDTFCPLPDPDCDVVITADECELNGWYGDGECDTFCPLPDPDCDVVVTDDCELNGWYGDGECDTFCPLPDPDCTP